VPSVSKRVSAAASAGTSRATSALTASNTLAGGAPSATSVATPTERRLLFRKPGEFLACLTVRDCRRNELGELRETILEVVGERRLR
jgi:hypothetical protein